MASSGSRGVVQQDYIARIRHSNALPVPPFPPKLLDIPNTGLSSGQYTSPAFGTRLLREQPLVIEADEFQGMDFNLVGFPGAFEGDDRYLKFPEYPAESHPKDRALLRPLNAAGKATSTPAGVTFLRRSEYTTSVSNVLKASPAQRRARDPAARDAKNRSKDTDRENPKHILRRIIHGFNLAYPQDDTRANEPSDGVGQPDMTAAERQAWERPQNPLRADLSIVDTYPLLPDLTGVPDLGSYMTIKFHGNPSARDDKYDERLDLAMLQPSGASYEAQTKYQEKMAEWQANPNPSLKPPELLDDFMLYLPDNHDSLRAIKRKFSVVDPQADDELLYDNTQAGTDKRCFKYRRVRKFQASSKNTTMDRPFEDTVAIALHDPETFVGFVPGSKSDLQKAAYVYPIGVSMKIKPARPVTMNVSQATAATNDDEEVIEIMDLFIGPKTGATNEAIAEKREGLYHDQTDT